MLLEDADFWILEKSQDQPFYGYHFARDGTRINLDHCQLAVRESSGFLGEADSYRSVFSVLNKF